MTFFGIHIVDHIIIVVYLLGITALGVWVARKVHSLEDFFQGGRRFGRFFMVMFAFGAGTHSDQAVGVAAKTYTNGMSGIWYQWLWLFSTPFYWLIAPIIRRMRALTTADYMELRYGPAMAVLYCLVAGLIGVVSMGTMLKGSGRIIEATTGGEIPFWFVIGAMTVLFMVYGVAGGLGAAIMTDFVQGLMTIVLSFLLLPFAMIKVGGFTGLHEKIPDPEMFSLVAPGQIGGFYIFMIAFNSLFAIVGQAVTQAICGASKSEQESRFGFCFGNFIKRFCTIAWCFVGMTAIVLYPNLEDPDLAFGVAAFDLLPAILPGLLGLLIASVLAAVMSSCDVLMNATAGLITNNVYRRFVVPDATEAHYVNFGRVVSVLVVAGGIFAAFWLESVVAGLEYFWELSAPLGIAFWMGVFWRRTTHAGGLAAVLAAVGVWLFLRLPVGAQFVGHYGAFALASDGQEVSLPWRMLAYLTTGIAAGIMVSLLTRRVSADRLERFYDLMRTPAQKGEILTTPCMLPEGVAPANPPKLINHPDFEIYRPTRTGLLGFAIAWVFVLAIIAIVYLMKEIGA